MGNMKETITFEEMLSLIDNVINGVFVTDAETGITEYRPECKEFNIRLAFMRYFTNVEFGTDINEIYTKLFTDYAGIYGIIIDGNQAKSILSAIDKKIEYRLSLMQNDTNSIINNLLTLITEKVDSIDTTILNNGNMDTVLGLAENLKGISDKTETAEFAQAFAQSIQPATKPKKKITKTK